MLNSIPTGYLTKWPTVNIFLTNYKPKSKYAKNKNFEVESGRRPMEKSRSDGEVRWVFDAQKVRV